MPGENPSFAHPSLSLSNMAESKNIVEQLGIHLDSTENISNQDFDRCWSSGFVQFDSLGTSEEGTAKHQCQESN